MPAWYRSLRRRVIMAFFKRKDRVLNWARPWKSDPAQDAFILLHLAWLCFSAALIRSWAGLSIALGVLFLIHLLLAFFALVGKADTGGDR